MNTLPSPATPEVNNKAFMFWAGFLFLVAIFVLLKFWLIASTIGTNDVLYWRQFGDYIRSNGLDAAYRDISYFNHPPLMGLWVSTISFINEFWEFSALLRLPSVMADLGSAWLVWKLTENKAATLLFASSPVLLLFSGIHGNTDSVMIFFILLATHLAHRQPLVAGIALGLAINIKVAPLMLIPAFWFSLSRSDIRLTFVTALSVVVILGFAPYVSNEMIRNIFLYRGIPTGWGFGQLTSMPLLIGMITMAAYIGAKTSLAVAVSLSFVAFLVFTPGFGIQYLGWLSAPMAILGLLPQGAFIVLAIPFFITFYARYVGGSPPDPSYSFTGQSEALIRQFEAAQAQFAYPVFDLLYDRTWLLFAGMSWYMLWLFLTILLTYYIFSALLKLHQSARIPIREHDPGKPRATQ